MDIWHVRGGKRLLGSLRVQGSKNAALPVLAASMARPCRSVLRNVPRIRDVDAAVRILRRLGCRADWEEEHTLVVDSRGARGAEIPPELMEEMRSSVVFMGALLTRFGEAKLSLPGGCRLGRRPIDLHLAALRQMGAEIEESGGGILCRAGRLHGAELALSFPSVGATENILLAACGAAGETRLVGAAREPEIAALADYLRSLGAEIEGAGSAVITVRPGAARGETDFRVPFDRIAAATLACACASAGGRIGLTDLDPAQFSSVLHFLNQAGCDILYYRDRVEIASSGRLRAVGPVVTAPYPGFPTDAQPLLMAALLRAEGETRITETIFENRCRHVGELRRLGAEIALDGRAAVIRGVETLRGAALTAPDLRAGAALIAAGLAAEGETDVSDTGHIARGYERLDETLCSLGAELWVEHI